MSESESSISIIIKHGSTEYRIDNLMSDHTISYLKMLIEELTNVKIMRQKLFGLRLKDPSKQISDETTIDELKVTEGMKIMMMGSQEKDIEACRDDSLKGQSQPFDDDFDTLDVDAMICDDPLNKAKIERRVKYYKIKMLAQPRPNKKLLVLDIDYTLFDHRTTAQSAMEIMRPYLHEFLTSAYQNYDIVIWSATSMRYIEAKMQELNVVNNPNYKILFYLDSGAMISVHSKKYDLVNVKPLEVIWGKFPRVYTPKNTIMFDDVRRNFLMNPQNGLKIKAFRDSYKNRETDEELLHLAKYLDKIAEMDDFSTLNHKHWHRMVNAPHAKRHK